MPNLYNNEVVYNGQTLISLKEDTATPEKVLLGETFHDRSGAPQTGSMITHDVYDGLDSTSTDDALSANMGKTLNDNLNDFQFTSIEEDANLNSFIHPGLYGCMTAAIAQSLSNCPTTSNFSMIVMRKSQGNQTQVIFTGQYIYTRTRSSSGWGDWYKFTGTKVS